MNYNKQTKKWAKFANFHPLNQQYGLKRAISGISDSFSDWVQNFEVFGRFCQILDLEKCPG